MSSTKISVTLLYPVLLAFAMTASAEVETPPRPCTDAPYNQFDFWLGRWIVSNAAGDFQGSNHLHKIMGNCGMQEKWTDVFDGYYKKESAEAP